MRPLHRMFGAVILTMFLGAGTLLAADEASGAHWTIISRRLVDTPLPPTDIVLSSLAADDGDLNLTVVFSEIPAGFFGTFWTLQLVAEPGVIPDALAPINRSDGRSGVVLEHMTPRAGAEYETIVTLDGVKGHIGIQVRDRRLNERLVTKVLPLTSLPTAIRPPSPDGCLPTVEGADECPDIEYDVFNRPLPLVLDWTLQQTGSDLAPTPLSQIARDRDLHVAVELAGAEDVGQVALELRLTCKSGCFEDAGAITLTAPLGPPILADALRMLRPGTYEAALWYDDGAIAWEIDAREVVVGLIRTEFEALHVSPLSDGTLQVVGRVTLQTDGPFDSAQLDITGHLHYREYSFDPSSRQFSLSSGKLYSESIALENVSFDGTGTAVVEFLHETQVPETARHRHVYWGYHIDATAADAHITYGSSDAERWVQSSIPQEPWVGFLRDETIETLEIGRGVTVHRIAGRLPEGPVRLGLLVADLQTPGLRIEALTAEDTLLLGAERWPRSTVTRMVERTRAVAGINASFFEIANTMNPRGFLLKDGELLKSAEPDYPNVVAFGEHGHPQFGTFHWEGHLTSQTSGQTVPLAGLNVARPSQQGPVVYRKPWSRSPGGTAELIIDPVDVSSVTTSGRLEWSVQGVVTDIHVDGPGVNLTEGRLVISSHGLWDTRLLEAFQVGDPVEIQYALTPDFATTNTLPADVTGPVTHAVSGGVRLLKNGHYDAPDVRLSSTRDPRTAIGVSLDGRYMYWLVVDGRSNQSIGFTYRELADFFLYIGSFDALNLDGGGSSTLAIRPDTDPTATIINTPSDGAPRLVPDGIGLFLDDATE